MQKGHGKTLIRKKPQPGLGSAPLLLAGWVEQGEEEEEGGGGGGERERGAVQTRPLSPPETSQNSPQSQQIIMGTDWYRKMRDSFLDVGQAQ